MFRVLILLMILADARWWWVMDRRVRGSWGKRVGVAGFMAVVVGGLLAVMVRPFAGRHDSPIGVQAVLGATFVWHLFLLPISLVGELVGKIVGGKKAEVGVDRGRRALLVRAAVVGPPVVTLAATGLALPGMHALRVRELEVPVWGLAAELDGVVIAHVSDTHMGRFSTERQMRAAADAVNRMRADLVVFTGDLIDMALADLPPGVEFLRRIDPRGGMFCIEGNHDLIERPAGFREAVRAAGLPYLIDEVATVRVRGVEVAMVGMRWWRGAEGAGEILDGLLARVPSGVMPVLLAHHPHVWDAAKGRGVPLMLAGHTHGGQMNLGRGFGFGPLMYRYWSGLYRDARSSLVVSNGVGNWFPLRVRAPAEVIRVTLRRI